MKTVLNSGGLLFLGLFLTLSSIAQEDDYINYYRNIDKAYLTGVFESNNDSTIFYMKRAFSFVEEPLPEDCFVAAQAYLNLEDTKGYYEFLLKSIEAGLDSVELNKAKSYSYLNKKQVNKCVRAYQNYQWNVDTTLAKDLDSIRAEDRRVRREKDNFGTTKEWQDYVELQDSMTRSWFDELLISKGWPGKKMIGNTRANVLLVHMSMEWINTNHNQLVEEIKKGNLNPAMLAYKYDLHSYMRLKEDLIYDSFVPKGFHAKSDDDSKRAVNRWEIGALSRKVFEARNYRTRYWKGE